MTATILSETTLPHLPSASGVEIIGPTAYVVSDDAPFLYLLDAATLAPAGQVQLFETADFGTGHIPKSSKPDLESMAAVTSPGGAVGLLLCGSGARANREVGYFVGLPAVPGAGPRPVQRLDLAPLYARLRARLPPGTLLNIEAAATTATELLLLQRSVGGGPALLFGLPLAETVAHLMEPRTAALPALARVLVFELPALDGCVAGFSGATFVAGRLYVTASVEAALDAVADGAVLGSFVGVVDMETQTATFARLAWADGQAYLGKVEGLAVRRVPGPGRLELLLVTDDDLGGSTALVAVVQE